jgi:chromosome segregation ATPase
MNRKQVLYSTSFACLTALAGIAGGGCENAADKQRKADEAQIAADQKKAAAEQEAQQKASQAFQSSRQEATKEQQKVDDLKGQAESALMTEKNDYRERLQGQLDTLDKEIADLRLSINAAPAGPTPSNRALDDVTKHRDSLRADLTNMMVVTSYDWPGMRAKIDKDLDESKVSARTAEAQIKKPPPRNWK